MANAIETDQARQAATRDEPLHVLVVEDPDGKCSALCLDFSVCVDGDCFAEAVEGLEFVVGQWVRGCQERDTLPMRPADARYWNLWMKARVARSMKHLPRAIEATGYMPEPVRFFADEAWIAPGSAELRAAA